MGLFDSIKSGFENFGSKISDTFSTIGKQITPIFGKIEDVGKTVYSDGKSAVAALHTDARDYFSGLGSLGKQVVQSAENVVVTGENVVGNTVSNALPSLLPIAAIAGGIALITIMKK